MKLDLVGDGKVFGTFELDGPLKKNPTGVCDFVDEVLMLFEGETSRLVKYEDEAIQEMADIFLSLDIRPIPDNE